MQSLETPDPGILVLGLPRGLTNALMPVLSVGYVVLAAIALTRIARAAGGRAILGSALLSLSQGLWFLGPSLLQHYRVVELPTTYFSAGVLAFMHCAQYLWITTYYAQREAEQGGEIGQRKQFRFVAYYATLIVGGLALFVPGPWLASRILGREFVESFLIFAALVNLHHFIPGRKPPVDGNEAPMWPAPSAAFRLPQSCSKDSPKPRIIWGQPMRLPPAAGSPCKRIGSRNPNEADEFKEEVLSSVTRIFERSSE